MRVSAQRNWQRVGLRMRRSDGRGILRSMIAESGCSRSVVAESAERGCRRVDCARIRTELAVVKRRMLELETNFDILVTQSVHAAVKCRDVAQATLLLKLEEQLATMQKRAWRMDHVRVKREEWQHLHTLHQGALAENSTLRSKVSARERKLVLAERKGGEASGACDNIRVALSAKRSGDALAEEALAEEALAEEAVAEEALAAQPKPPTTKRKRVSWAALEVIVYAPLGRTRP